MLPCWRAWWLFSAPPAMISHQQVSTATQICYPSSAFCSRINQWSSLWLQWWQNLCSTSGSSPLSCHWMGSHCWQVPQTGQSPSHGGYLVVCLLQERCGERRYDKLCTMPYMSRNQEWAMLTRYSNSLWVIMWKSSSILNSFSKAWTTSITSEMGTLSDWYLTISLSSGTKIMRAFFNLTTNWSLVMTSLTFWHPTCCATVPLMKSLADEIACRCDSESSKLWHICWMVPSM